MCSCQREEKGERQCLIYGKMVPGGGVLLYWNQRKRGLGESVGSSSSLLEPLGV